MQDSRDSYPAPLHTGPAALEKERAIPLLVGQAVKSSIALPLQINIGFARPSPWL